MKTKDNISRRSTLKGLGAIGAAAFLAEPAYGRLFAGVCRQELDHQSDIRKTIFTKVFSTPLIDTHEHLIEEHDRLKGTHRRVQCDDWSFLMSHYLNSDMLTGGMPRAEHDKLFSRNVAAVDKWNILAPYWPAVRNTGYGMAVEITMQQLYDVPELGKDTIGQVASGYEKVRRKGFYKEILCGGVNTHIINIPRTYGVHTTTSNLESEPDL